nr:unnamed protein product [Callosobruchus analis]
MDAPEISTFRLESDMLKYQDHFPNIENFERPCAHNGQTYNCVKISEHDIIALRRRVLHTSDKVAQDRKLSYFCKEQEGAKIINQTVEFKSIYCQLSTGCTQ